MADNQTTGARANDELYLRLSLESSATILRKHRASERVAPAFSELTALLVVEMHGYPKRIDIDYRRISNLGAALNSLGKDEIEGHRIMTAGHYTMKEHYKISADLLNGQWGGIGCWTP
ncbi:hypothetical protein [Asaia sp. VD9]|uniref:hypothetical protein n=1 Tax=Asaia sp. VD9 TaxID=3081235 RepID=UPI0030192EF9